MTQTEVPKLSLLGPMSNPNQRISFEPSQPIPERFVLRALSSAPLTKQCFEKSRCLFKAPSPWGRRSTAHKVLSQGRRIADHAETEAVAVTLKHHSFSWVVPFAKNHCSRARDLSDLLSQP
jgi:hypothetical protein